MRRSTMSRKLIALAAGASLLAGGTVLLRRNADARRMARDQALVQAVSEGDLEQTAHLLQAGANIRTRASQGESLLFVADGAQNPELFTALLKRGLSLRERDAMGLTVLHRAARRGDTERLTMLLELGQPVDELDARGRSALGHALRGAHFDAAHLLLAHGARVGKDTPEEPPLLCLLASDSAPKTWPVMPSGGGGGMGSWMPVSGGIRPGVVSRPLPPPDPLIKYRGRLIVGSRENAEWLGGVRELLASGADPNARNAEGRSVMEVAISQGRWKTARLLVETLGGWRDKEHRTALRVAAELGNDEGVAELYCTHNRPKEGAATELTLAVWVGDHPRVQTLLNGGADPNQSGIPGRTPLVRAAARGDLETVKRLLAHRAQPAQTEAFGFTPLHLAAAQANTDLARAFLAAGVPINVRTKLGRTPLHEVASATPRSPLASRFPEATVRQADRLAMLQLLLQHGADPNLRDVGGTTPLQAAVRVFGIRDRSLEKLLVEHGSSVLGSGDAEAPLLTVAEWEDVSLAALLLAHGADLNEVATRDGATPLWRATMTGQLKMMRFLASRGARLPETVPMFGPGQPTTRRERVADIIQRWDPSSERRRVLEELFPELKGARAQPASYMETGNRH